MVDTAIKICGLQSVEVVKSLLPLQVDWIGFVFAPSRRQVPADQAGMMIEAVKEWGAGHREPKLPKTVGVFVNPAMEELEQVLGQAKLDVVQLHGQERPEFCRQVKQRFGVEVFKALAMRSKAAEGGVQEANENAQAESEPEPFSPDVLLEPYRHSVDAILLDTYDPVYGGGSGVAFDWSLIKPYQAWAHNARIPLLIAGGLHERNVGQLVRDYHPDGVDVSSGVEREGVKDIGLITAFVERVRGQ
ncbi:hypothetical protein AWM70_09790 [Paenibacillus yonginensis]|uniref:N-(5'-phosphoribosyl)anthranilate isomerase n=1 Tax=Paenibacillus yonginensis TaxID=1462996 RepID=A0A1B1N0A7_9BACL|nr:phosphoribosylanthranilate isomerase [Paenibacillus yonginensis]ANS74849.1 hypothetical protein AWM70_09790 [Paenibacillus yonginensis]